MATGRLNQTETRQQYFQQTILLNLHYWREWVAHHLDDTVAADQEQHNIVKAITFALEFGQPAWSSVCELIEQFAPYMERRGYWNRWQRILRQALTIAERCEDKAGLATMYALLARLLSRQSLDKEAIAMYRRALRLARQMDDGGYGVARACTNLGYLYIDQGQWWRAEMLCKEALSRFEQLDNDHGRAHTENHLGILCTYQGQFKVAQEYLQRACVLWQKNRDMHGLIHGYNNLGRVFNEMAMFNRAVPYFEQAIDLAQQLGEEALVGRFYMNLGIAYRSMGKRNQAMACYQTAQLIFQQSSNLFRQAKVLDNLGWLYIDQQHWGKAEEHFQAALQAWRQQQNRYAELQTLIFLVEFELARAMPQRVGGWLKQANQLVASYSGVKQYQPLLARLERVRGRVAAVHQGESSG